jgi:predicted DNA-binding transcriptional regulator AlpA
MDDSGNFLQRPMRVLGAGFVKLADYAAGYGLSLRTLKRYAQQNKFPSPVKLGRSLWIKRETADKAMAAMMRPVQAAVVVKPRGSNGRYLTSSDP